MKKLLMLLIVMIGILPSTFAQKAKIQTAWNYYKYEDFDRAKTAIDEASVNETTSPMAKTWYYRGLIYQKIYKHEKFGNLDPDPLMKAAESYQKALKIEPKYEFEAEIRQNLMIVTNNMFGQGVEYFNAKTYDKALNSFENVLIISPSDTLATLNAAYSAERAGNKTKAKSYYNQLISMKYKDPKIYIFLGNLMKTDGDTTGALATVKQGRQLFPADNGLVIEELNIYLAGGKDKEALESLNLAIQGDPNNINLHFAQGTVYDKLGRKSEAAVSYKKAMELKPDFFDAYYNLGAMYFNEAAEMANKANDIKSNTEYAKAKEKFDAKFKEAQPYLERALELKPDDTNTMISLKQLYARLNETTKYELINAKLKGN
jgi:Tfp pilus assembly protein PilF